MIRHSALCLVVGFVLSVSNVRSAEPIVESPITNDDRAHWAYSPIRRPDVPQISAATAATATNPIDYFIGRQLEKRGLTIQPPAPANVLARRLAHDLTGLPAHTAAPSRALDGNDARSVHRFASAIMSSPSYGERWAQHWLDLARFAETDGFEHDKIRSEAWRYRDWVIKAWNEGMSYDQFVTHQLAADRTEGANAVATMFCTSGPDMPDINSQVERRAELLNEMTGTVGATMLAMQIGCAQCHDHKYDPISQADFFRLRALFAPSVHLVKNRSVGPLAFRPDQPASRLLIRGDWRRPGPVVSGAAPRVANPKATPANSRPALANWIIAKDNPLAARVIANRIWQHHFGRGIVSTPSDFGVMGEWPTHPELLDYLACELRDHQWSLRRLQLLIVTSSVYRQRSTNDAKLQELAAWKATLEADPNNQWLARFPRKRRDGESVRDAMLAASDSLNRKMGGPGVRPPLPPELKQSLLRGQWDESPEAEHYRRSIYVFARRNLRYPVFEVFDRPEANASCPQRSRSTTAPQALLLLNSPQSLDAARRLAGWVLTRAKTPASQVTLAYRRTLDRAPTKDEVVEATEFLEQHVERLGRADRAAPLPQPKPPASSESNDKTAGFHAAMVEFCLALLNCNEFLYLD